MGFERSAASRRMQGSLSLDGSRQGQGKREQSSLRSAGLLPTLKKPGDAIGFNVHITGDFWENHDGRAQLRAVWAMPRSVERPPASDGAVVAREAREEIFVSVLFAAI